MTVFGLILVTAAACNKGLDTYSGVPGLYFAMRVASDAQNADTMYRETTILPFVTTEETDSTIAIRVKIVGNVSSQDRRFRIETVPDSTTLLPGDCDPVDGDYLLPAGEVFGIVPITFHRQPSLEGEERALRIRLVANEDFTLPIPQWKNSSTEFVNVIEHTVLISDKYVQLPGYSEYAFGPFSEKKMKLLLDLSGKDLDYFNQKLSHIYTKALGQKLDRYLKEQEAKGQPVCEEDGTRMVSGKNIYN